MSSPNPSNAAKNTYIVANVTDDEATNIQPLGEESLKNGDQFVFRETFSRDTTNSNLQVLIEQPSSADDSIRVIGRVIEPNQALDGSLSFNVGVNTAGTQFRYANGKVQDPMPSVENVNVEYGGDYDKTVGESDALPVKVLDTGQGNTRRALDSSRAAFRLTPGTNILYDVDAQADGTEIIVEFIVSERPQ